MNTIEDQITDATLAAGQALFSVELTREKIQIQPTRKEFDGEFTVVVFPLVKLAKKSPEETGKAIGDYLFKNFEWLEDMDVVKGFLNLKLKASFWLNHLCEAAVNSDYGKAQPDSKPLVMVEYSSPNTNKPLHLGHLRNNFLGYSVAEILKAAGHTVKKVQIINDRGIHICKSMVAWSKFGNGETPESTGIKGDHLVGKYYVVFDKKYKEEVKQLLDAGKSQEEAERDAPLMVAARETLMKWEAEEPQTYALWESMNQWVYSGFEKTYERMGVDFDQLYFESQTWSVGKKYALEALESGSFFKKSDGSVWVDLSDQGLDEKLILRKDGTAVYMTQDIGTAILRYRDYPGLSKLVYTVGNEQEYHFKVLFLILQKLGYDWAKDCHHLSYGMVELPEGKMKSREGTVVDADDIMESMARTAEEITEELGKLDGLEPKDRAELYEMIGIGALKYFLLRVDPKKNMLFNPEESIDFNGHTGPFIQYAYARIQSLLRNYGERPTKLKAEVELSQAERRLQMKIYEYPKLIESAAAEYNPAQLANFLYDLAKDYGSFYQNFSVLKAETEDLKEYRILLSFAVGRILKSGMEILGIDVPEQM
ncbi:MAG TPA: arginine--tRNA ligase [Cryomorphaceae bacterium]|nr:arginine--tRNA ligase [Cryomorphaceae bacterium]